MKLTERHLEGNFVIGISSSSFDRAFGLFRWVWEHRKEARRHQEFFPLALQMGYHLHRSLAKSDQSTDPDIAKSLMRNLKETLEFLSHDHRGLHLASDLHADTVAIVVHISTIGSSRDSLLRDELDDLRRKLEMLGASKDALKVRKYVCCHV